MESINGKTFSRYANDIQVIYGLTGGNIPFIWRLPIELEVSPRVSYTNEGVILLDYTAEDLEPLNLPQGYLLPSLSTTPLFQHLIHWASLRRESNATLIDAFKLNNVGVHLADKHTHSNAIYHARVRGDVERPKAEFKTVNEEVLVCYAEVAMGLKVGSENSRDDVMHMAASRLIKESNSLGEIHYFFVLQARSLASDVGNANTLTDANAKDKIARDYLSANQPAGFVKDSQGTSLSYTHDEVRVAVTLYTNRFVADNGEFTIPDTDINAIRTIQGIINELVEIRTRNAETAGSSDEMDTAEKEILTLGESLASSESDTTQPTA